MTRAMGQLPEDRQLATLRTRVRFLEFSKRYPDGWDIGYLGDCPGTWCDPQ